MWTPELIIEKIVPAIADAAHDYNHKVKVVMPDREIDFVELEVWHNDHGDHPDSNIYTIRDAGIKGKSLLKIGGAHNDAVTISPIPAAMFAVMYA